MSDTHPLGDVESLSDDELVHAVSEVLAVDRTEDNSFVLHAPLELLARADLLARVSEHARRSARARLASVAAQHARSGDPIEPPPPMPGDVDALVEAINAGKSGRADAIAVGLVSVMSPGDLCRRLAPATLRAGTAAAHAPILFGNWPRTAASRRLDPRFTRGTIRRLCRPVGQRIDLPHPYQARPVGSVDELDAALRAVPHLGSPGFGIYRLVCQTEEAGLLAEVPALAADRVDDGFRVAFRIAATSMVADIPDAGPYEWTHCLSLPVGLWLSARVHADPREALDVALTHVVGFRAGYGGGALPVYDPAPTGRRLADALDDAPAVAAATAFHDPDPGAVMQALVDDVAAAHDAHLVKYVHALGDAIRADPEFTRLYLAAGAHLVAWWRANPPADDPLR